jgi:hypothetical protein
MESEVRSAYVFQLCITLATIFAFGHLHLRLRRIDELCCHQQEDGEKERIRRGAVQTTLNISKNDLWLHSLSKIKVRYFL